MMDQASTLPGGRAGDNTNEMETAIVRVEPIISSQIFSPISKSSTAPPLIMAAVIIASILLLASSAVGGKVGI